ncbi:MAG: hypothetical protein K2I67_01510 [Malacoplasma sp.]|nr:hypothetical protein [Malacoplasma sp.]
MQHKKKIKVNFVNNLFWLAPKISSYFRGRRFGYIPYKTLEELITKNDFLKFDFMFSFNRLGEKNYDFFNALYRLRKFQFRLGKDMVYKISKEGFVDDNSVNESLIIRWDLNSLKTIQNGYIPFYSEEWYIQNFIKDKVSEETKEKIIITWDKKEFKEIN